MQIGGPGSSHGTSDHHVTSCLHDHHDIQKNSGGAAMKASAVVEAAAAKAELQQEGAFSLSAWVKNMLGSGKGFLSDLWDGSQASPGSTEGKQEAVNSAEGSPAVVSPAAVQTGDSGMAAVAAVQLAIQSLADHDHHHFSAAEDTGTQKQTFRQRMRMRFQNVSGRLSGRLSRKYSGFQTKNSFQAKQEKPREDLRRHNRYRKDTVEINCARTEESYLMDSYDRKGKYATLTTRK